MRLQRHRIREYLLLESRGWRGLQPSMSYFEGKSPVPHIAAIPAESIPFLGVAVLIADTGYELYAACETVRELDQLYVELGMTDETPDDVMHSVCEPKLPDAGEAWDGVVEKSGEWHSLHKSPPRITSTMPWPHFPQATRDKDL